MEKFLNWLGIKIYNNSDTFKNIIYGIYYKDILQPQLDKVSTLTSENILLKVKLNATNKCSEDNICEQPSVDEVPVQSKKRKYTKRKKLENK